VRLRIKGRAVCGLETAAGFVAAPRVVLAAGAWSVEIGRAAHVRIPLELRPRQSFATGWRHDAFPDDAPMLIGSAPFPHVRPEARSGAIFGWEYRWHRKHVRNDTSPLPTRPHRDEEGQGEGVGWGRETPDDAIESPVANLDALKDPRFPSITLALLARQFGDAPGKGFADGRYMRSIYHNIGYYVYRDATTAYRTNADGSRTPYESERAILDAHPDVPGLFLSIAHVGHGVMSAPAGGEIIAAKVLGQPLPDPIFADFGIDVPWVAHDENAL
jgi:glycine/D-amino acid oxidase-like deaminating enzyme